MLQHLDLALSCAYTKLARRDLPKCPICEERIDPAYWQAHYEYELGRLDQVNSGIYQDPLDNR